MYRREVGRDEFILREALSFRTAVMPQSLDLMIVIKVMINEVNSISCLVEALQFWYKNQVMSSYLRFMSS